LTTIFEGTHGWYWKNYSAEAITITLNIKGDYKLIETKNKNSKDAEEGTFPTRETIN
jgi:hypothetical protein